MNDMLGSTASMGQRDITSLRAALDWLRTQGDLMETDREVDPDLEITAIQKALDGGPPILFNRVKGRPQVRAITNLFGDINVLDKLFGFQGPAERTRQLGRALTHPLKPREVSQAEAPCQAEVITDDLDVNKYITAIRHTLLESELTVGSGITCLVGDYFDGGSHIGYNRMNFRWGNVGTFQISPGSHMWQVMTEHYRDDKPIPLTICFGVPPACTLLAATGFNYVILPKGCDEIGMAGAVQGRPVDIVRARTVDAWAIAESECVLEGYLHPRDKRWETAEAETSGQQGKAFFHPEWSGYMGKAYRTPTFHVTAITRRSGRPIVGLLGVHNTEDANMSAVVREASYFQLCERLQPGIIQDVHMPFCLTDYGGCIIKVKKRNAIEEGWPRNFLVTIMACSQGMRLAIAVSEDVDIYSMDEIMWCLTTRVNPKTDILNPLPGGVGQTFMPAERMTAAGKQWTAANTRFEGGMAIDATVPYGYEQDFHRPVYPVDRIRLEDFFDDQAIAGARSRMRGWSLLLSKTGR